MLDVLWEKFLPIPNPIGNLNSEVGTSEIDVTWKSIYCSLYFL